MRTADPTNTASLPARNPAVGPRNDAVENPYDTSTGMPISIDLNAAAGVTVYSLVMSGLPSASQGVIYYKGNPVAAGQVITAPDLNGFSFKPADNYSGDVNFNFGYRLTSPSTGPATNFSPGAGVLRVDSVADLAAATSEATGRAADGNDLTAPGAVQDRGWAVQNVNAETSLDVTFTVHPTFTDLDGSERAWIDVELPQGFTVPVTLTMDNTAPTTGNSLEIRVVTQETDTLNRDGHNTSDNTAVRVIPQDVPAALFPGQLTVEAGWAYEGNKTGGTATADLTQIDIDQDSTVASGAPLNFDFTGGTLTGALITVDINRGQLLVNGFVPPQQNGAYVLTANDLQNGVITFTPLPTYTDQDVPLSYVLTAQDPSGNEFTISGSTTIVMDAVADVALINAPTAAVAELDNDTLDVTVSATFSDTDGSERHYVIVEKKAGWDTTDPHEVITVYFDAAGNPLQPSGVDASGNYTYDTASAASSKEFYRFDVTAQASNGAAHEYTVHMLPDFSNGDTKLFTGTLGEEAWADKSGLEHDVANNQAFTFDDPPINLVDTMAVAEASPTYEDHKEWQFIGSDVENATDGTIVMGLTGTGEYFDTNSPAGIVMTFTWNGQGAPGTFLYNGVTYSPGQGAYQQVPGQPGVWRLTLPSNSVAPEQDALTLRYNPPADDDTDLTNLSFQVPVVAGGTGYTGMVTTPPITVIVDAAADKPLNVSAVTPFGSGAAAITGAVIDMEVKATFGDYTDNSETHYLVFDLSTGLNSVDLNSTPVGYDFSRVTLAELHDLGLDRYADGSRYVVIHVPNDYLRAHNGVLDTTIKAGVDTVTQDTTLRLDFTAVAVDTPSDNSDEVAFNNIATTPGSVTVNVHTITSNPVVNVSPAYEDDTRLAHIGQDGANGAPLSVSGIHSSESLTTATITFDPAAGSLYFNGTPLPPAARASGAA